MQRWDQAFLDLNIYLLTLLLTQFYTLIWSHWSGVINGGLKQGNELYSESNRSQNIWCVAALVVIEFFTSVSPASWRAACMGQAWVSSQCVLLCWYFFAPDDFIFMLRVKKSTYPLKAQLILMEACIRTLKQSHLMFRSPQQNRMLEDLHVLPLFRFFYEP